jgi:hypothetical protein
VIVVGILMVAIVVEIALIGKNITFSSRFTPPSTENVLKNESYYAEVQMLILFISAVLLVLLPLLAYSIFMKSKRYFFPLWVAFMAVTSTALICNVYYLTGSKDYRNYLNQVAGTIGGSAGYCEESMCNKVTCARIGSFKSSESMTLAYSIIDLLCSLYIVVAGVLINLKRRKNNEIELIM